MRKTNYSIIKVLSLGVGMAIAMVLIAKICFELSYDNFYADAGRIYKICTGYQQQGESSNFGQVSGAVAPGFKEEIPGVTEATRITNIFSKSNFVIDREGDKVTAGHIIADSCFFRIFDRPFLAGDPEEALRSWNFKAAVSRSFAEKLGGTGEAVGKEFTNEEYPDLPFTVCGVYEDFPKNGSLHPDIILCLDGIGALSRENWLGNDRYVGFVKLADGVDPDSLQDAIRKMQESHQPLEELEKNGTRLWYYLSPLVKEHRSAPQVRNQVFVLSIVVALLLLISVMNYILVAIAGVMRRAKEVGVRKCYGARGLDINWILLKETAGNVALSLVLSALLVFAFRGRLESLLGVAVRDMIMPVSVWIIIAMIVTIFLVTAIIPARMFVKIPISSAFRGYRESRRRWKISLLAFQFAINAALVSLVLIVSSQYRKVLDSDLGYDYKNLVYGTFPYDQGKMNAIADAVRRLPEVEGAELTYVLPLSRASGNNVSLPGDKRDLFNVADEYGASEGFFGMMGFRLVDGSAPKGPDEVAVSKSFVTKMAAFADWPDGAVGKVINISEHGQVTICGVYEDYVIGNAAEPETRPSIRFCWDRSFHDGSDDAGGGFDWSVLMQTLVVRLKEMNPESMRKVEAAIDGVAPDGNAEVVSYAQSVRSEYDQTRQMKRTYSLGALLALLIAVIGLISYVRDENCRRSAEIAVRKVNGAQSSEIIFMLVADLVKLSAAAVLIGDVAAWLVAGLWLRQFAVKVALNPLYFIVADLAVVAVVAVTVAVGSLRIARTNPVDALKSE